MKLAILISLVFVLTSCGEKAVESIKSEIPAGAVVSDYPTNPNLKQVTVYFANKVTEQGDYLNGARHGTWTQFYENTGGVSSVTTYINGVKQGLFLKIDDRGTVEERINFHNDQPHGKYVKYNRGKIIEERDYDYGMLNGVVKKFYDSGTIMEESNFENGKRNGISKWYDQEGNLTIEYEYVDGELIKDDAPDTQ